MTEVKSLVVYFSARKLVNPEDPVNSSWENLIDPEADPYPDENNVTGTTYEDCLWAAAEVTGGNMEGVVIAREEVTYMIPSPEELSAIKIAVSIKEKENSMQEVFISWDDAEPTRYTFNSLEETNAFLNGIVAAADHSGQQFEQFNTLEEWKEKYGRE